MIVVVCFFSTLDALVFHLNQLVGGCCHTSDLWTLYAFISLGPVNSPKLEKFVFLLYRYIIKKDLVRRSSKWVTLTVCVGNRKPQRLFSSMLGEMPSVSPFWRSLKMNPLNWTQFVTFTGIIFRTYFWVQESHYNYFSNVLCVLPTLMPNVVTEITKGKKVKQPW